MNLPAVFVALLLMSCRHCILIGQKKSKRHRAILYANFNFFSLSLVLAPEKNERKIACKFIFSLRSLTFHKLQDPHKIFNKLCASIMIIKQAEKKKASDFSANSQEMMMSRWDEIFSFLISRRFFSSFLFILFTSININTVVDDSPRRLTYIRRSQRRRRREGRREKQI